MMLERPEEIILNQLIHNEDFHRTVIPHLEKPLFHDRIEGILFSIIAGYSEKYNGPPSVEVINIVIGKMNNLSEEEYSTIIEYRDEILSEPYDNTETSEWLIDLSEEFLQDQSVHNAVSDSIGIIEGKDKDKRQKDEIPSILSDALSKSFDTSVGHDYNEDFMARFEERQKKVNKTEFDLEMFNLITNGGVEPATLNCVLAPTGAGKTIWLCHQAASWIAQGGDVLYVTAEMAENKIADRIDANLLKTNLDMFMTMSDKEFGSKFNRLIKKGLGRLIVKQFPTACAHVGHVRSLLRELAIKKKFKPQMICIDYLNIMTSMRVNMNQGSYHYVKAIAEEFRGLAVEHNIPIWTATQTNRGGYDNSDLGLDDTSESFGLPSTLDLYLAMMVPDKLAKMNRVLFKQLKNRYRDERIDQKFLVGLDKPKMTFYDVKDAKYTDIDSDEEEDDTPLFDKSTGGRTLSSGKFKGLQM